MAEEVKRYYWLKLQDGFFGSRRIKKLRKLAGGDTFTIIYLKMQLASLKTGGVFEYTGVEDSFAKEVALEIEEDEANVEITINFLLSYGLLEACDSGDFFLPYVVENTGSETASAKRVRDYRNNKRKSSIALQSNTDVTEVKHLCNVEKEIEKEIEKEKEDNECTEQVAQVPAIELILNTKDLYPIYQSDIGEWVELYPNVNIMQELRKMKGWLDANPKKRKTKSGIKRFINSWLSGEQDKGSRTAKPTKNFNNEYYDNGDVKY